MFIVRIRAEVVLRWAVHLIEKLIEHPGVKAFFIELQKMIWGIVHNNRIKMGIGKGQIRFTFCMLNAERFASNAFEPNLRV